MFDRLFLLVIAALLGLFALPGCTFGGGAITIEDGQQRTHANHVIGIGMRTDTFLFLGDPAGYTDATSDFNANADFEGKADQQPGKLEDDDVVN